MKIYKPKSITTKMRGHKFGSGVNMSGVFKEKHVK
jgi:hypothetical protein